MIWSLGLTDEECGHTTRARSTSIWLNVQMPVSVRRLAAIQTDQHHSSIIMHHSSHIHHLPSALALSFSTSILASLFNASLPISSITLAMSSSYTGQGRLRRLRM